MFGGESEREGSRRREVSMSDHLMISLSEKSAPPVPEKDTFGLKGDALPRPPIASPSTSCPRLYCGPPPLPWLGGSDIEICIIGPLPGGRQGRTSSRSSSKGNSWSGYR